MSVLNQNLVYVYYTAATKKLMGRLLLKERQIFFEYDNAFIKTGVQLSRFTFPLKTGVIACKNRTFEGLFGVFNDSLPDGWGRLLLDRKLMNGKIDPGALSPLDRLCFVGSTGMGALSFEPEHRNAPIKLPIDLDENDAYVEDLLLLAGSSAGARPKVLVHIGKEEWMIKFRSNLDPKI